MFDALDQARVAANIRMQLPMTPATILRFRHSILCQYAPYPLR